MMRIKLLFLILVASTAAHSQLIISQMSDSILYNAASYTPAGQQYASNGVHTVVYNYITDPSYQMQKLYMDSGRTKLLSHIFYHQGKLNGPYTSYQMNNILAKGRYKKGKLDGERLTYYNGGVLMEKAFFTEGKRTGTWEHYNIQGVLKRRVTYTNGVITQDQQF